MVLIPVLAASKPFLHSLPSEDAAKLEGTLVPPSIRIPTATQIVRFIFHTNRQPPLVVQSLQRFIAVAMHVKLRNGNTLSPTMRLRRMPGSVPRRRRRRSGARRFAR